MPFSKEAKKKLLEIFKKDLEEPLTSEKLVQLCSEHFGRDVFFCELFSGKIRRDRMLEIIQSQNIWFGALGWWFAKLFMWGALIAASICWFFWGKDGADLITWGLSGAAIYYALIQILTPWRLSLQKRNLLAFEEKTKDEIRAKIEAIEKEL